MQKREPVGYFSKEVIEKLALDVRPNTPIFISQTNITHIREKHTDAYIKYYDHIPDIIESPDYIGIAGVHSPSIEYIKRFKVEDELVNIAIRATKGGVYYLRSMFVIEEGRLNDYINKGYLIKA